MTGHDSDLVWKYIAYTLYKSYTHIIFSSLLYFILFLWYWYYPVQRWWWLSQYLTGELNTSSCLPSSNQPEESPLSPSSPSPLSPSSSPPASPSSPSPWYEPFLKFLGSHLEEKPRTWRQKDVIGEVFQDCQHHHCYELAILFLISNPHHIIILKPSS